MGAKEDVESLQAPVEVTIVAELPDGRLVRLIAKEPKATVIKVHPLYGKSGSGLVLMGAASTEITGYNIVLRVDGVKILEQETLVPMPDQPNMNGDGPS